jgi:hypothetical protein
MADAAIFIGWGAAVRGREQQALQVFDEVLQYYGKLQQNGQIAGFEPVALEPHGGDLAGFLLIRGEQAQLERVRASQEFIRMNTRGTLVVEHLGVVTAFVGDELKRQYAEFGAQASELSGGSVSAPTA